MSKCICSERQTLGRIEQDIKSLLSVRIVNSNKTTVTYSRDEFFQMLYDRPREMVRKQFSVVERVYKIIAVVNLVILTYMAIVK